jgi:hypothetical protein
MRITKEDLSWAASEGLLSAEQSERLWEGLEKRKADVPRFDAVHVLYYFGALLVISAMGWFMTEAWESFGGGGILVIAVLYALCFALAGRTLWFQQGQQTPGGLLFTLAVCMTPLAIYGLERLLGIWPQGDPGVYRGFYFWVKGSWFLMEVGTILAALVALRHVRFPFLTAPIAFSLWFMSMDLAPLVLGTAELTWDGRLRVSLGFGLLVLLASFLVDRRTEEDFAFWGYLFGLLAFWGGLFVVADGGELSKLIYCLINLGLVVLSVLLRRGVFMVFGALGVAGYLGHLADRVFQDSLLFPFVLSLIGIAIMYAGLVYHRNQQAVQSFLVNRIPEGLRRLLPSERVGR